MVGTEIGLVIGGNRKGKNPVEKLPSRVSYNLDKLNKQNVSSTLSTKRKKRSKYGRIFQLQRNL